MNGQVVIGATIDTKQFDKQIEYVESRLEEIEYQLEQADLGFEVGDTQKLEQEYEKLSNRLIDLKKKKQEVNETPLDDGGVSTANFGKGIEKITKKITRMGLAMIGIRSLYGMISSSVSRIADENPQLQAQIDAIRNAIDNVVLRLIQLVLPVIEVIVQLVGKLLKGLFGIDIYSNNFNKNMKKANGSATKIRKQLMGFDEMNILNKDGSIGGLGGKVEVTAPTDVDLSNIKTKIQNWFDKNSIPIKIDYVIDAIENPKEYIETAWEHFIKPGLLSGAGPTAGAGLIFGEDSIITKGLQFVGKALFGGIPGFISNVKTIWEWIFGKPKEATVKDLKDILNKTGGLVGSMGDKIRKEFANIKVVHKNGMVEVTTATGQVVQMTETEYKELMDALGYNTEKAFNTIQAGVNATKGAFFKADKEIESDSNATSNNTKTTWWNRFQDIVNKAIGKDQNSLVGGVTGAFTTIQNDSNVESNNTKNNWFRTINDIIDKATGNDKNSLVGGVLGAIDTISNSNPEVDVKVQPATKGFVSSILDIAKNTTAEIGSVSVKKKSMKDALINALKGVSIGLSGAYNSASLAFNVFGAKGLIFNPPRLASGGILNRPGRGVFYGGATIAEHGREAVVPLTDSQQMAYLGREIAKHIPINLTNVTELDGRVIARSVSQVMNEMNFASNGGVL